jgi:hypothetical protein
MAKETMMLTSRRTLAFVALALVLAGGMVAGFRYLSPTLRQGGSPTGAEVRDLISGNTVKGTKFSEYYAPDGSIRGREIEDTDEEYLGTWHIDGDQLCVVFPSHDFKSCVSITREPDGTYDFAGDGRHSQRTIVAGNPDKL